MKKDKKLRHSKYKNTGLIFELLVRQTTSDVLNEKDHSVATRLIKKYFLENKPLGKELRLYKTLMETKFSTESKARDLIDEVINYRGRMGNSSLKKEKYNLIKDIKENYNLDEFFKSKMDNYKDFASIYKLFESTVSEPELFPDEVIQCRHTLIERIMKKPATAVIEEKDKALEELNKQNDDLKKLTHKIFIEKFNDKYKSLDSRQKNLLKEFIYNGSDVLGFRLYVNSQIDEIKNVLVANIPKIEDKGTQIKVEGMLEHLVKLKQDKGVVSDENLVKVMRFFELTKEVEKACSKENAND